MVVTVDFLVALELMFEAWEAETELAGAEEETIEEVLADSEANELLAASEEEAGVALEEVPEGASEEVAGAVSEEVTGAASEEVAGAGSEEVTGAGSEEVAGAGSEEVTGAGSEEVARGTAASISGNNLEEYQGNLVSICSTPAKSTWSYMVVYDLSPWAIFIPISRTPFGRLPMEMPEFGFIDKLI